MNLRQVRYFTVVARELSVSRAAERLHITQPALSRQIQSLEEQLGVALLERQGRGIRLTHAAEQLLPRFADLLAQAAGLRDMASELATAGPREAISVGVTPHFIETVFAPVLAEYRNHHKDVDVVMVECRSSELSGLLERGDIHLALGASMAISAFPTRPLPPVPYTVVPPDGHRFLAQTSVEVDELANEGLLLQRRGFLGRAFIESACLMRMQAPTIVHESESIATLLALAEAGVGVAVVQANADIRRRAIPLVVKGEPLLATLSAAWNPTAHLPSAALELIDAVDAKIRQKIQPYMLSAVRR